MAAAHNWWSLPLPANYEAKYDPGQKRYFFINHNDKSTTWEDPRIKIYQQQQQQQQRPQQQQQHQQPSASGTVNVSFAPASPHRSDRSAHNTPRQQHIPMQNMNAGWQQQDDDSESVDPEAVKRIKRIFPTAEEWAVRKALAKHNNSEGMACNELSRSGYKRQNASQQQQESVVVSKLRKEFPSAEEGVVRDVVQCVNRDEGRARTQLKQLGYTAVSRSPSPAVKTTTSPHRQPSPQKPKEPSDAEKKRKTDALKKEFPSLGTEFIEMALKVANYDDSRAKTLLKMEDEKKKKKKSERSPARTLTTAPTTTPTTTAAPSATAAVVFQPTTSFAPTVTPSSDRTTTRPATRNVAKKTYTATTKTAKTTGAPTKMATGGRYVSANRTQPLGPDSNLVSGPDKDLLIQEYTNTLGPDPDNYHGSQHTHVKNKSEAKGPDPELYHGPDPDMYQGPGSGMREGGGMMMGMPRPLMTAV